MIFLYFFYLAVVNDSERADAFLQWYSLCKTLTEIPLGIAGHIKIKGNIFRYLFHDA